MPVIVCGLRPLQRMKTAVRLMALHLARFVRLAFVAVWLGWRAIVGVFAISTGFVVRSASGLVAVDGSSLPRLLVWPVLGALLLGISQ